MAREDVTILPIDKSRWPQWAKEAYEERAGIMEHMGKMPKQKAEKLAEQDIRRIVERNGLQV